MSFSSSGKVSFRCWQLLWHCRRHRCECAHVSCVLFAMVLMGSLFGTLNTIYIFFLCLFRLLPLQLLPPLPPPMPFRLYHFLLLVQMTHRRIFDAFENIFTRMIIPTEAAMAAAVATFAGREREGESKRRREKWYCRWSVCTHDGYLLNDLMTLDKRWQKIAQKFSCERAATKWILEYISHLRCAQARTQPQPSPA